jgi:hypothetical protein
MRGWLTLAAVMATILAVSTARWHAAVPFLALVSVVLLLWAADHAAKKKALDK